MPPPKRLIENGRQNLSDPMNFRKWASNYIDLSTSMKKGIIKILSFFEAHFIFLLRKLEKDAQSANWTNVPK